MVSIIIVHYNTFDLTYSCVKSCFENIETDFEIILVNNGSEEKDLDELLSDYPSVKVVNNGQNLGFAKGNNLGIANSSGEYILLLNSDCELVDDAITKPVHYLSKNENIGVLTVKLTFANGQVQNNYQSFPSIVGDILELTRLFKINKKKYAKKYANHLLNSDQNTQCDWVWGAYFLFKREDLEQLQLKQLNDHYFMYGEDMHWCWQFHDIGKTCFYFSETTVVHHMGQSNFGSDHKKWRVIIANEINTIKVFKGVLYTFFFRCFRILNYTLSGNRNLVKHYFSAIK